MHNELCKIDASQSLYRYVYSLEVATRISWHFSLAFTDDGNWNITQQCTKNTINIFEQKPPMDFFSNIYTNHFIALKMVNRIDYSLIIHFYFFFFFVAFLNFQKKKIFENSDMSKNYFQRVIYVIAYFIE